MRLIPTLDLGARLRGLLGLTLVCAMTVALAAGCGEDSTGPSEEEAAAQALADDGFDILGAALGGDTPDFTAVGTALGTFEDALELDSNNADANVGRALCEMVLLGNDPSVIELITMMGGSAPGGFFGKALRSDGGFGKALSVASAGEEILSPMGTLNMMKGTFQRPLQTGPPDFSAIQDVAEAVILPVLNLVITALDVVQNQNNWSLTISIVVTGSPTFSLEIDETDLHMLEGMVRAFKAEIHAMVAYNLDLPVDMMDTTAVKAALNQTDGTFLKLRTNGATNLGMARTELLNAIISLNDFRTSLLGETDDQTNDLIVLDPTGAEGPTAADLDEVSLVLAALASSLTGATSVTEDFDGDGLDETMDIYIGNLFTNPVQDVKQKIPPYSWYSPELMFLWDGYLEENFSLFVWPDPTMNGLFPDVSDFNVTFGIEWFPSPGPFDFTTLVTNR